MLVSLKCDLAILALPKTGSTTITQALRPHCDIVLDGHPSFKHLGLGGYHRLLGRRLAAIGKADLPTFCLFREPLDWLGSWYRYRRRGDHGQPGQDTSAVSFEQFVQAWLSERPPEYARLGWPSRFVAGADGAPGVTFLFRYENFGAARDFLEGRFRRKFDLSPSNVSPAHNLALTPATRDKARDALAAEYAIWNALPGPRS